jgi:beta-mannosidase
VTRQDFYGEVRAEGTLNITAAPGQSASAVLDRDLANPGQAAAEVLAVEGGGHRALWYYGEDKDLALPAPELTTHVERADDGFYVIVEAPTLQRDVALLSDRAAADAVSDDMLFTLLPGESKRIHVRSAQLLGPEALVHPSVLRSANQLRHAG